MFSVASMELKLESHMLEGGAVNHVEIFVLMMIIFFGHVYDDDCG
jgi:hypothetical protein